MKFLAIIFYCLATLNAVAQGKFEIKGTVDGYPDGTMIFLSYKGNDGVEVLDSVSLINDTFNFTGELSTSPAYTLIRTKDYKDYMFMWMEPTSMTFKARKGKFKQAAITGSETQQIYSNLQIEVQNAKRKDSEKVYQNFISVNPNSLISIYLLEGYKTTWGKAIVKMLYDDLSEDVKNSADGTAVREFLTLNKSVEIGDRYIDFSQEDKEGNLVSLSDFDGKVVLLEFWGSWCAPCRKTNPELVKIYDEYKDKGFEIVGVAADNNKQAWLRAIEVDKLTWTNVSDLQGDNNEVSLIYGISYYPTNFLIDRNGVIVAKDVKGQELEKLIEDLL